jgi:hypothetical protein
VAEKTTIATKTIAESENKKTKELDLPPKDLITLAEAGIILEKTTGTVSRLADRGEIKDNHIKGKGRRVSKTSVLLYKHNLEGKQEKADFADYRQDKKSIPKIH